jgi:hypothetical protein
MECIVEPNDSFDFSKLTLAHPTGIQGGACFTKIEYNKKSLFIQTPKSLTRQGFVKTGKKYYCDLMFDKNSETLINWFENLEEKCQKLIYEKKDSWFRNAMEETDIESAFNSIIRIYKSGRYYLVRTNIKNNDTNNINKFSINIYDEEQSPLTMENVTSDTHSVSIIEIQGIKFTSRNFQIEIELKQVMVLNNSPMFNNCLIKTNYKNKDEKDISLEKQIKPEATAQNKENELNNLDIINDKCKNDEDMNSEIITEFKTDLTTNNMQNNLISDAINDNISLELDIEDLDENIEESDENIKEVDIDINLVNNLETFKLKKPNQVYFDLYKEARNKAKLAKKQAIIAYLEAKNIKKTYMIENLDDSESDFDAEIDEVSESELEGL